MVEIRLNDVAVNLGEQSGATEQKSYENLVKRKISLRVRYAYGMIFLITNLIAWFFRDYGEKVLPLLQYLKACRVGETGCFHALGVLRVSLGCFIFFFLMFLTTCNTSKLFEARTMWHSGWWILKCVTLIISLAIPFFIPFDYIQIYGEIARIGAGVFLALQLVSVIEFITWWNNYWMPDDKNHRSWWDCFDVCALCLKSIMCPQHILHLLDWNFASSYDDYILTFEERCVDHPGMHLMAFFPSDSCLFGCLGQVNRGLLSSGIMASYVVFLCWSAIRSEPATAKCSPQTQESGHGGWTTVIGFLIAICAIVMATFSTGIDSKTFQFRKNEVQSEDDIPYKYGFFHLVFSLGAMYFAMLFVSWNLDSLTRKWSIDVGWSSTWVKIVNEWFAATIYIWKLISPVVRQTRVMHNEERSMQGI